jgi:XTP/dITP diphosphohydrolase
MRLIFATNNKHKIEEIRSVIGNKLEIITLEEAGIHINIPEPHNTLEENASEKSRIIYQLTNTNCFSEDTGLEVDALNGEPGVHSARYAGEARSFDRNIEKLLFNLQGNRNRKARFRAIISLRMDGKEFLFEGICNGNIIEQKRGNMGFGYDPVFVPEGASKTFSEMNLEEKNKYSHRKKAMDKLFVFLNHVLNNQ